MCDLCHSRACVCVRVAFATSSERRSVCVALVAVAGRRCAYIVCTSVGQDGGWARIGSLGKVRIGSLGKVQSAWCNRTGSRAGWGSAVQLPPRPGVCSAAPSEARALRRAAVRTSRLGWWVDS